MAKTTPGDGVHWKLSDKLGAHALGDALVEGMTEKLMGTNKIKIIDAVRVFRVRE